jgi:hypothetical protein
VATQSDNHSCDIRTALPRGQQRPTGLLVCRDLIFINKITATAAQLGYQILVADKPMEVKSLIELHRPRIVIVDLAGGESVTPALITRYKRIAGADVRFLAFGPHVDLQALSEAKTAGCELVLPRSTFTANLPELLHRCFCGPVTEAVERDS